MRWLRCEMWFLVACWKLCDWMLVCFGVDIIDGDLLMPRMMTLGVVVVVAVRSCCWCCCCPCHYCCWDCRFCCCYIVNLDGDNVVFVSWWLWFCCVEILLSVMVEKMGFKERFKSSFPALQFGILSITLSILWIGWWGLLFWKACFMAYQLGVVSFCIWSAEKLWIGFEGQLFFWNCDVEMWFCELIWEVLRRLLETNFRMLCSSLDALSGNMSFDCIRIQ